MESPDISKRQSISSPNSLKEPKITSELRMTKFPNFSLERKTSKGAEILTSRASTNPQETATSTQSQDKSNPQNLSLYENRHERSLNLKSSPAAVTSPKKLSLSSNVPKNMKSNNKIDLELQQQALHEQIEKIADSIVSTSKNIEASQTPIENINKIAEMSKQLTNEANALRDSIKSLNEDIAQTKEALNENTDINHPYHLFLIEIIVNKIHMKCECFEVDYKNLVISASFLGKQPIILYDPSFGKIENFKYFNIGKSTLFAMTYDKICGINEFIIQLQLTKQPPCASCITKIGETSMNFTNEFISLREEICTKWREKQPDDDIKCTKTMPLTKNTYYLSCGDDDSHEPIGLIVVTVRLSFLGKEITTAFCPSSKSTATSLLLKQDQGITMYSCHKVEMNDEGKILLDENIMKKSVPRNNAISPKTRSSSLLSSPVSKQSLDPPTKFSKTNNGKVPKYDEIFTKMNANELRIRVPKSSKVERNRLYEKIEELCTCESTHNTGQQIQLELPLDSDKECTYASNLKYNYTTDLEKTCYSKDGKLVKVIQSKYHAPPNMEKTCNRLNDVFILKVGKKLETMDKKTDLEIELVTPKGPSTPVHKIDVSQQYDLDDFKKDTPKKKLQTNKKYSYKIKKRKINVKDKANTLNLKKRKDQH